MKTYYIHNVDCETCARKIETHIQKKTEAKEVTINLISSKLLISDSHITADELTRLANQVEDGVEITKSRNKQEAKVDWKLYRMIISFSLLLLGIVLNAPVLYLIGYVIVGYPVVRLAVKNMLQLQFFDEYFLMSIATIAALTINQFSEALAVMLFYSVGEYIQERTLDTTKMSITKLAKIGTRDANKVVDGQVTKVDVEELQIGDVIRVASGEKVGVDAILLDDHALIDTSHLSGESEPQQIINKQKIYGGSINCGNIIDLEVVATADESMVAKLIELVTYADSKKTRTEQFITRFSKVYTPIVVVISILIAVFFPIVFGISQSEAIYRAVTLLVISCPCAFVLSVPLGYVIAIGTLAKEHVLVKGSMAIDRLNKITTIAVDKTGTLTTGKFEVVEFTNNSNYDDDFINSLVASGEEHVVHPIAKSLFDYANNGTLLAISDLTQNNGTGIEFKYQNNLYAIVKASSDEAYTVSHLLENGQMIAGYKLQDKIKPGISKWIASLKESGIRVLMLTGDNFHVANMVADKVGIADADVFSGLLPEEKLNVVETQINGGDVVAFIGDGLNDAAVIKRSDLGISMGATGSELSIDSSDVVISDDNITKVLNAINVSHKANQIIKQNIIIAFVVKIIFILLGIIGITTMWEAVFSDVGVTLIAIANSMRIKRK
ncbi:heavy metal translocating P-type ATPase [Mollicutes bacterium LVI A0039]|nr:heavy metal translocating P-type ATPase [Mollicutes bacterium LVI A0039]